jgi:GntR family transcriptional repressor for pyruvate dehydrogenase complex
MLTSRQGAGVFVASRTQAKALVFDPSVLMSMEGVLQIVEVRRALEANLAALAAQRITPEKAQAIMTALHAVESCPLQGEEGVQADLAFHRSIARATDNPHFERLLGFLEQYLREAMNVTRANEACDAAYAAQVRQEHQAIAKAVIAGDADEAAAAAHTHMVNATQRIKHAAPAVRQAWAALQTSSSL